ncbi:hypothetical protein GH5_07722 [Leishmania sp. Ghana 2012 LV757]|uniref:hypothetical protein n=1 Tax=Leishmania sp. Ghana 2012 LV757 TaxID=2803181 RepID=UPI001B4DAC0F|nr:hypothetical protein GH5_07722 [Leishmania sp. Ghana 2012 LV757]
MASAVPWYCRYGVHGDLTKEVNVDGTAVYRTRERLCDCMPPRLDSLSSSTAHPRPHPPPPQRCPGAPRRRSGRGLGTNRVYASALWKDAHAPLPTYALPGPPGEMIGTRLHVLVPPLSLDSAVGDFYAGYVSSMSRDDAAALPSIPVVRPRTTLERGLAPRTAVGEPLTAATAPLGLGSRSVDSLPVSPPAPLPAAPGATPSPSCAVESNATGRLCSLVCCPTYGQRVTADTSSTAEAAQQTPARCSMGPHVEHGAGSAAPAEGTDKQVPASVSEALVSPLSPRSQSQQSAVTAQGNMSNTPTKREAGASHTLSPPAAGWNTAAAGSATAVALPPVPTAAESVPPDLHIEQDMRAVDAVISHLLHNAAENGGRLRPPCGLPHCRLCDPSAVTTAALSASPSSSTLPPWPCGCWGTAPVMCGSPAVAIIHHHYAK